MSTIKEWKRVILLLAALTALASLAIAVNVTASPSTADPALTASISGTRTGNTISYSAVLSNSSASAVGNIFVAVDVPSGTSFSKVTATPAGFGFQGVQGTKAVFLGNSIAANSKATIGFDVNVTGATVGDAAVWAHALTPSDMTASGSVSMATIAAASAPRRGCLACHVLVDPVKGNYTLPFEAEERAKARGLDHPQMAPDGTSIKVTDVVGPDVCLQCHAPGKGDRAGMGNIAPLSLRDIVHPAHMFSETFKEHYGGQCFTCHNVNGNGGWELIGKAMNVNEKGVPNSPTTGLIPPSEGGR